MRGTREWQKTRSTHARVLEALEASIAAHPASGRREQGRSDADRPRRTPTRPRPTYLRVCDAETVPEPQADATVLRFVPRPQPETPDAA